jgi:glycosyltransferase involved in cell wall biosynthesis
MNAGAKVRSTDLPPAAPRMRVCLVTEAAGGGVGRHFLDLATGLAARGMQVSAIYSPGRCDAAFLERLPTIRGVQFVASPMRRAVHALDAADLLKLIGRIREVGAIDLIHGHSSKGGALARLAARWLGIPSVYTPHAFVTLDPTLPPWKRRLYGSIEQSLARHTARIIAVSDDEAAHARQLRIDPRKVCVINNGVEHIQLSPRDAVRSRIGLLADEFVIGFVGRFTPQKNPELLLDALDLLVHQVPRAKLLMVGSGPLESAVRRRIETLRIADHVVLIGEAVATTFLPALDVFCLSSRYEGLPYVLLEALAAGLPIVSTQVGGAADCVESHRNGLIVHPPSSAALAQALAQLASQPELRQRFAAHSAAMAERFSLDRMVDQTVAVYGQVLAQAAWRPTSQQPAA